MSEVATSEEHAEFCERVKARRKELGLTQAEVAERLGMKQGAYAQIELGVSAPGFHVLYRVAESLETTVHELMPVLSHAKRK
jgi:transcriptional regulator with XRE-family HTH domain